MAYCDLASNRNHHRLDSPKRGRSVRLFPFFVFYTLFTRLNTEFTRITISDSISVPHATGNQPTARQPVITSFEACCTTVGDRMKSDPLRAGRFCESTARPRLRYRTENQNRLFPCITCCGFACVASFVSFSDRPAFQISRLSHGLWNTRLDNRRVRAGGAKLNRLSRRIPTTGIREPTNDDLLVFIRFRFFPRNYNPIRKHS